MLTDLEMHNKSSDEGGPEISQGPYETRKCQETKINGVRAKEKK